MAFLLKIYFGKDREAKRTFLIAQKIFLRVNNKLQPWTRQPDLYDVSGVRGDKNENKLERGDTTIPLSKDQRDGIYMQLIKYFEDYNLFELAEKALPLIKDPEVNEVQKIRARIAFHRDDIQGSLETLNKLIDLEPENPNFMVLKAN